MQLEHQLKIYKDIANKINALEEQKKMLGAAILAQMQSDKLIIADYTVRRYERLSIKLTLDEARSLNAVKTEEVVDKDKIKAMHELGQPIQGVSVTRFIQVTTPKSKTPPPEIPIVE